jgi:hypothetical protein
MATEKQSAANRKNALKSLGPTSVLGKMISSRNSTRHGFYATSVVLPDEDHDVFVRFARRLVTVYAPADVLEEEQVRTIIETRWQLRRATKVDTELFQMYRSYEGEERGVGTAFAQDATQGNAFSKVTRYQGSLIRILQNAEKALAELKKRRPLLQPAIPLAPVTVPNPAQNSAAKDAQPEETGPSALQLFNWLKGGNSQRVISPEGELPTMPGSSLHDFADTWMGWTFRPPKAGLPFECILAREAKIMPDSANQDGLGRLLGLPL